jgi:amino acid transporter
MKIIALVGLNLFLAGFLIFLLTRKGLLAFRQKGRWWLTWLAIGVITLMDEFTSIFYAPAEAYRFIGSGAIIFIALTSLLIRFMSTRFTEIAEILEHHNIIGGGVYSFSYFVLGPMISFVAVASIMVDYTITACISAVSAVTNAMSFAHSAPSTAFTMYLALTVIWFIACLNIAGIRENARFTFMIFIFAAFVILNLIVSGIMDLGHLGAIDRLRASAADALSTVSQGSWVTHYDNFVSHIAICILAYSGIESVIQTAGLVKEWRDIHKAYWFLALTVGVVTPVIAALALSAPIDFARHETDLIPHYATLVNGELFGFLVAVLAAFTLMMAVNTAFVASSELLERVLQRYGFKWLMATNRRDSLYRIHVMNALFFSSIILITRAQQNILADMYAIGLVASFCINIGSLLVYRYFMGTSEIGYHTSRVGTLIVWIILVSCFIFLAARKMHGTMLWGIICFVVLIAGFLISRRYAPEIEETSKGETVEEVIVYLAATESPDSHIYFRRPEKPKPALKGEAPGPESQYSGITESNSAYITFYSPRTGIARKMAPNHFRLPLAGMSVFQEIVGVLQALNNELPDRHIVVHIGWPMSSWLDRLAIGVLFLNMMRLPRLFPTIEFIIRYRSKSRSQIKAPREKASVEARR